MLFSSLAVLFVVLYLLLFPRTLPPEFTLVPVQATVLSDQRSDRLTPGGSFFLLGGREGYWSPQGIVERVEPKRPQAMVWKDRLAWYDASQSRLVVESPEGVQFTLAGEQFPYWVNGRLLTLDENRMSLTRFDERGKVLWTKRFSSLITSLDATATLTSVGTLDGRLQLFGTDGRDAGLFQPGGSRLPVVYNVALAPQGGSVLVLAGVDPKRFLILEKGGSEFRPVFHKPLKESRPWPTPLGFLAEGSLAYYQTDLGLALIHPRSPEQEIVIPTRGEPFLVQGLSDARLFVFVQESAGTADLRVASVEGASLLTLPMKYQDLFVQLSGNTMYLGMDQTLLRLEIRIQ